MLTTGDGWSATAIQTIAQEGRHSRSRHRFAVEIALRMVAPHSHDGFMLLLDLENVDRYASLVAQSGADADRRLVAPTLASDRAPNRPAVVRQRGG
jgi:hypothetical protein